MPYIKVKNNNLTYKLKRNSRAKKISLKVNIDGDIEVVSPPRVQLKYIEDFVKNNECWLLKQLDYFKKLAKTIPRRKYVTGETLFLLGEKYFLKVEYNKHINSFSLKLSDNTIQLTLPSKHGINGQNELIKNFLEKWYRTKAKKIIIERLEKFNKHYNFTYNKIFIKNQKTRWGSCSTLKNLNFNWRIIIAPIAIVDYIVVHELCHLKEQNHSSAFWSLVEQQIPDYKERRNWLKINGMTLVL